VLSQVSDTGQFKQSKPLFPSPSLPLSTCPDQAIPSGSARNRELIAEKKEQLLRMREKDAPLGEESAEHH